MTSSTFESRPFALLQGFPHVLGYGADDGNGDAVARLFSQLCDVDHDLEVFGKSLQAQEFAGRGAANAIDQEVVV